MRFYTLRGENEVGSLQAEQIVDRLAHRCSIQPRLLLRKEALLDRLRVMGPQ